jgi:hypothetical protein
MFVQYTDIIYEGHFDHPIHITFDKAYISLTGEGGNRHIIVGDKNGYIDIWIDTHLYGDKYFAFLGSGPYITGNPSAKLINRVWSLIVQTIKKDDWFAKWTKKTLNEFFENLYSSAKMGFYF